MEAGTGRRYVRIFSIAGTLAVYRILTNDRLKRLKRWPAEIGEAA
jgi:hypothetical protein